MEKIKNTDKKVIPYCESLFSYLYNKEKFIYSYMKGGIEGEVLI